MLYTGLISSGCSSITASLHNYIECHASAHSSILPCLLGPVTGVGTTSVAGISMGTLLPISSLPRLPIISSASPAIIMAATEAAALVGSPSPLELQVPILLQLWAGPSNPNVAMSVPAGMFLKDGLLPLPQLLVSRIIKLEFVDMSELLSEAWMAEVLGREQENKSGLHVQTAPSSH